MLTDQLDPDAPWSPLTPIVFRFLALYLFLYVVTSRMIGALVRLPTGSLPDARPALRGLVAWTADHVFHVTASSTLTGSGDRVYDWVQAFCLIVMGMAGCALWSILDRTRTRYDRIYRWFRVFVRFALGSTLIGYGFEKVFPFQMSAPQLTRLLEPYGNFSLMGVLWSSIGASFPYERVTGLVEVIGGGLLFFPRTQLVGAFICLCATLQVFALNMTYDVPVKLFSLHLVLMSVVLIAPYAEKIGSAALSTTARTRWAAAAQAAFGLYLLGMAGHEASKVWMKHGPGAAKPQLYGIWTIDTMMIDGIQRLPLVTDYQRWRRLIVEDATTIVFWRMDDTFLSLKATMNTDAKTITLVRGSVAAGTLTFEQPAPGRLILDGALDQHRLHMETQLLYYRRFELLSRGFHWVQESPVNR